MWIHRKDNITPPKPEGFKENLKMVTKEFLDVEKSIELTSAIGLGLVCESRSPVGLILC
jgi:hypothetical protein